MTDYLYKFPNEATAQTALADYYDNGWQTGGPGYALDPVGVLMGETGELDETEGEIRNEVCNLASQFRGDVEQGGEARFDIPCFGVLGQHDWQDNG